MKNGGKNGKGVNTGKEKPGPSAPALRLRNPVSCTAETGKQGAGATTAMPKMDKGWNQNI